MSTVDTAKRLAYLGSVTIGFSRGRFVTREGRRIVAQYVSLRAAMEAWPSAAVERAAERAALRIARRREGRPTSSVDESRYVLVRR
jgi:hypothetical protein